MRATKEILKDFHEEELFDYYATSQLILVSLDGTVKPIAPPAIYTALDPSPDEKYLMLTSVHRPYSSIVSYKRFPKKVELWTVDATFIREVCDLPLAEDIPITSGSVRKRKRLIRWRPDMPSTLYWFAVLADPTIPIIGEGDQEANDRYIEQLVASAEAVVNEIVRRGRYGHTGRLPTCIKMSPFMSANKIKKPILLIHGEDDSKVTIAMQSSKIYDALKGNGVPCGLVILPFERHHYVARESVMHVIWETDRWLEMYCASNSRNIQVMESTVDTARSPACEALALYFTKIYSLSKLVRLVLAQIFNWEIQK